MSHGVKTTHDHNMIDILRNAYQADLTSITIKELKESFKAKKLPPKKTTSGQKIRDAHIKLKYGSLNNHPNSSASIPRGKQSRKMLMTGMQLNQSITHSVKDKLETLSTYKVNSEKEIQVNEEQGGDGSINVAIVH